MGWVGRVCADARHKGVDLTCYNLGVRRDTSADIAQRWESEANMRLPDEYDGRLVFSFGTNDCADGDTPKSPRVPLEASMHNARSILSAARAWKPTLVVGPLPVSINPNANERVKIFSEELESLSAEVEIHFLNFMEVANSMTGLWQQEAKAGDGVHPNRGAYAHLAEAVICWSPWQKWVNAG